MLRSLHAFSLTSPLSLLALLLYSTSLRFLSPLFPSVCPPRFFVKPPEARLRCLHAVSSPTT